MDVGGHYARADVFNFSFNADRPSNVDRIENNNSKE